MKYLIVGLGNPGKEYQDTRHNIGFKVLDSLVESSTFFSLDRHAERAEIKHKGRQLILIKPTTFMNLSGKAVNFWMQKEKVPIERVLVITDDISIPLGKLRLRAKGSHGGHNGLRDIALVLNTEAYPRLRFGVGNNFSKGQQVAYVLGKFEDQNKQYLETKIKLATDLIKSFVTIGLSPTMTQFNKR